MFGKRHEEDDMYDHAKMAHIAMLKKRLHGMMADEPHSGEPGEAGPELHDPVKEPADYAMSTKHGMSDEGSPEEEVKESTDQEMAEGGDELARMKKDYFRPKPKPRRPGTAMMIAISGKPSGNKGRFGKLK